MIFDITNQLSDDQAVTATAVSTNVIDLGVVGRDVGKGSAVPLRVQVSETFNNLTSLQVSVQTSVDEAFSSPINLTEQTKLLADLTVGDVFDFKVLPTGNERYIRLNYTVTGTAPTTGKVTAGVTMGNAEGY